MNERRMISAHIVEMIDHLHDVWGVDIFCLLAKVLIHQFLGFKPSVSAFRFRFRFDLTEGVIA